MVLYLVFYLLHWVLLLVEYILYKIVSLQGIGTQHLQLFPQILLEL